MDDDAGRRDDDQLLAELRDALADDPAEAVPAELISAAQASYTWRTIEAELAELTYDSLLDEGRLVAVRSATAVAGGPRALTFEHGDIVVDIEVTGVGATRTLLGQVVAPAVDGVVVEELGHAPVELDVDDVGRFRHELIPGLMRLRCRFPAARDIVTGWMAI